MYDLSNKIQKNNRDYYKFATVTLRVYVDKSEVERVMEEGYFDGAETIKPATELEAFDLLASEEVMKMFHSDVNVKHYETDLA